MGKSASTKAKTATATVVLVPLNSLRASASNVRKSKRSMSLAAMMKSIQRRGLLQNLIAHQVGDVYEVDAGGFRLEALQGLAKKKAIPADHPIPCRLIDAKDAITASAIENEMREAMHPADQFDAFLAMFNEGQSVEEIAADFGVSSVVVQQRLKLASVAPSIMERFRKDDCRLDVVMAYALLDDTAEQERIWNSLPTQQRLNAYSVRNAINQQAVAVTDARVRYIGVEAYEAAGGKIAKDLFNESPDRLTDPQLVDKLVAEKMAKTAAKLRKDGWGWVEAFPRVMYEHALPDDLSRLPSPKRHPTAEEAAELRSIEAATEALDDEEQALEAQSTDELDDAVYTAKMDNIAERRAPLDARMEEIEAGLVIDPVELRPMAGVVIALDSSGKATIFRGLVRKDDKKELQAAVRRLAGDADPGTATPKGGDSREDSGLSEALCRSLTAERTVALRAALTRRPDVALVAVVHSLLVDEVYEDRSERALNIQVRDEARLQGALPIGADQSKAEAVLNESHVALRARLPKQVEDLWTWLLDQEVATLLDLLAHVVAIGVDTVVDRVSAECSYGQVGIAASMQMAKALQFDMADWWQPTAANYLGRVRKEQLVQDVTEAAGRETAAPLAKLKKGDAVAAAERALAGTRWLPAALRLAP